MTTIAAASIILQLEQLQYSIRACELVAQLQKHYQKQLKHKYYLLGPSMYRHHNNPRNVQ
jgi:hypothetical protein